jgi:hypothetical protein
MITLCTVILSLISESPEPTRHLLLVIVDLTLAMSFRDIVAEVQNLTEDEKRQLLELLECDLCNCAKEESPEFLAMLEARISAADKEGRTYTLAQAQDALKNFVRRSGRWSPVDEDRAGRGH